MHPETVAKKGWENFVKSLVKREEFIIFVALSIKKKEQVLWINDEVVAHRRERYSPKT
jgi:hypothetical protein